MNELGHDGRRTTSREHIELAYVTYCYFDQENHASLTDLLHEYDGYPKDILDRVQFVVIDDGSPIPVSIPEDINLNILFLRVDKDIPWNLAGVRNLGVVMAPADKVFSTDIDHKLPVDTFRHLVQRKNPGRTFFMMGRRNEEGKELGVPSTIVFFSRARYLKFYGVDEQFSGHYGVEDTMFRRWQRYHGTRFRYLPSSLHSLNRSSLDLEASYHSLERDETHNQQVAARIKDDWKAYGPAAGHSRQFLNFPWHIVEDRTRDTDLPPLAENRRWARTWWWRWLFG